MKKIVHALSLSALAALIGAGATAQQGKPDAAASHRILSASELAWGDSPMLPPGVKAAVLDGDPGKPGPFVIRIKAPDGYKIPAHWHPTVEYVTVLSGTFHLGMGDKLDPSKTTAMSAGAFTSMPAEMRHYAWCEGETVVQVSGMGPFQVIYVDPKDDPRQAKK